MLIEFCFLVRNNKVLLRIFGSSRYPATPPCNVYVLLIGVVGIRTLKIYETKIIILYFYVKQINSSEGVSGRQMGNPKSLSHPLKFLKDLYNPACPHYMTAGAHDAPVGSIPVGRSPNKTRPMTHHHSFLSSSSHVPPVPNHEPAGLRLTRYIGKMMK